jgi:uncharacterized iron-regulated membrane protein
MRKYWIKAHLWLGVSLGIFWAVQGLTGALLVFHRELDRIGGAALTNGPMIAPTRLIQIAEKRAGQPVQRLTAVSNDQRLIEARYNDAEGQPQAVQLDAASGKIVGSRERDPNTPFYGSAWRWIYLVHISLLAGPIGRIIVAISGLILAMSVGAGLYIGWPKRRAWGTAFSPRKWRNALQKLYGWHRALGIVAGIFLIFMGLTGFYMAFASKIAPSLASITSFDPSASMSHQMGRGETHQAHVGLSADDALQIARREFPQGKFMNLELPVEHPGYYSVRFTLSSEWRRWSGRAMVRIDATSGEVIGRYDPRSASFLNRVDDAVYPFHMGEALGLSGRLLAVLIGLALPILFVTGFIRWRRRRLPKPAHRAAGSKVPCASRVTAAAQSRTPASS